MQRNRQPSRKLKKKVNEQATKIHSQADKLEIKTDEHAEKLDN